MYSPRKFNNFETYWGVNKLWKVNLIINVFWSLT